MSAEAAPTPLYHSPWGLLPFQADGVVQVYLSPSRLAAWDTGLGKALRVDQQVATPLGWRQIGSLSVGDEVFGQDGKTTQVVGVYPQGVREMVKVTVSDGTEVICDRDHLWAVRTRSNRYKGASFKVRTTQQIMDLGLRQQDGYRHFLPVTEPVVLPERELPLHPYLLGVLLGDGGLTQRTARITSADGDYWGWSLPAGVTSRRYEYTNTSCPSYALVTPRGHRNPVMDALDTLGLSGARGEDKHVPDEYLWSSIDQRMALLQGLLDSDGSVGPTGVEFASTSEKLVSGVRFLVESLGGCVTQSERWTSFTHQGLRRPGRQSWRLNIFLPGSRAPFLLNRKVERWTARTRPVNRAIRSIVPVEAAEAVCIKVDRADGLFLTEGFVVTHNTHLDMASVALLFEDSLIDLHLLICEQNKVSEWVADFARFTDLNAIAYAGTMDRRRKIILSLDSPEPVKIGRKKTDTVHHPQVLVGTYETFRNDLAMWVTTTTAAGRASKVLRPAVLTTAIADKRLMIGYDEMTKVGNRGSTMHKAIALLLKESAKAKGTVHGLGLTATPIDSSPESYYNLGRLLCPQAVGTVESFETDHVQYRDLYGRARYKNLTRATLTEPWVTPLEEKMAPILLRKRKTDDDVREQFPETSERIVPVLLSDKQQDFYEAVRQTLDPEDPGAVTVLRQIAGIPEALAYSQGALARAITEAVGVEGLRALDSTKADVLLSRMQPVVDQGDQAVVFTFYGPSMIPLLAARMRREGIVVAEHYGALGSAAQEHARDLFKTGQVQVLLSSDSGARGINLPQAAYAFEFEAGITHAIRTQRLNRIHRIDSRAHGHDKVYFQTLVAKHTIEDGLFNHTLERNEWSDLLLGDDDAGEHFMTAAMRRRLLAISRPV